MATAARHNFYMIYMWVSANDFVCLTSVASAIENARVNLSVDPEERKSVVPDEGPHYCASQGQKHPFPL